VTAVAPPSAETPPAAEAPATAPAAPAPRTPAALATLPQLLRERARQAPGRVAFRHKELGIWRETTWAEYLGRVRAFAFGLRSLGIGPGDRVAIHSENRPEWLFADLAAESVGAVVVGIYPTNPPAELAHVLRDCGARVLVAEDQEQVDKALAVIEQCPDLAHVVVVDPRGLRSYHHPALVTYAEVERRGRKRADRRATDRRAGPDEVDRLVDATTPDAVSCIVYTSGTTGPPKGAMLTHANCLAGAAALVEGMGVTDADTAVSYLPLSHVAERMWSLFISLLTGITVNFAESVTTVQADIFEIAPTFFGAVPRIAEKMQAEVEVRMADAAWVKRRNYRLWMRVGRRLARERLDQRGQLPRRWRAVALLGELLLYRPLRRRLGLRNVRHCLVGAAPPAPELVEWFHAIGVPMVQAYGQTECGGASHLHRGGDVAYDTVGTALPGYRCRLDPATGEVLLQGAGVFAGYWGNSDATATALRDGWLHTGDQGTVTDRGHLKITGRLKDVIITSGGKNVSPDRIENAIKFSPYVREAVLVGDGRHHLAALIGIERDTVAHWAERHGIPYTTYRDLSERPEVVDLVQGWLDEVNRDLATPEQVKRFRLLPKELHHEDEELTATQKVRRAAVAERFADLIEELYR
jgi:long-chain acyl-CoA synthetase